MAQTPQMNGAASAPSPAAAMPGQQHGTSFNWDHDKMLNIYIIDYFAKHGYINAARELRNEAHLHDPESTKPPIDARQGFLYEWWVVFWEIFQAKSSKQGKPDGYAYIEHTNRLRAMMVHPGQQGPNMQGRPMMPMQGQPMQGQPRPPGAPGAPQPGQIMVNGNHQPPQGQMPNGAMIPPGQPGAVPFQVSNAPPGMPNGAPTPVTPMPPQGPSAVGGPSGAGGVPPHAQQPGRPNQYASPVMVPQQHPGGPPRQPQGPLMGRPGMGMMPMQAQHPGMQPGGPYGPRPGTPAATPGAMRSSPSMPPQQPEQWRQDWPKVRAQLLNLQEGHYARIRAEAGIPDKVDLNSLNEEQTKNLVIAYNKEMMQSRPNTAPSPRNPDQSGPAQRRGAQGVKRASTSPEDDAMKDSSPPNKRQRPSPPMSASEVSGGMTIMNAGAPPPMNGIMQPRPPIGAMPNGMHPGPPGQMQGMPGLNSGNAMPGQPMGPIGGPPGQPIMMHGPQGQMMGRPVQPGMQPSMPPPGPGGPGQDPSFQRQQEYRLSMAAVHKPGTGISGGGQMYTLATPDGPGIAGPSGQQPMNAAAAAMQRNAQQGHKPQAFGTGHMAPPGSPAAKAAMMPPQAPTPKEEGPDNPVVPDIPAPSPSRPTFAPQPIPNVNAPQPYPPVGGPETRSASTPAGGAPPGSQPSPAQPPPPTASAPPPAAASSVPPVSNTVPTAMFPDLQGDTGMPWSGTGFDDPLASMNFDASQFDEFSTWIHNDIGTDMIGGV